MLYGAMVEMADTMDLKSIQLLKLVQVRVLFALLFINFKYLRYYMLENVEELIDCAYENSCKHGFHDEETSYDEQMMLVITEVSEMVNADRKGKYCDLGTHFLDIQLKEIKNAADFACVFKNHIKDSVEDEFADICIRLFDICGAFDIKPFIDCDDEMKDEWLSDFGEKSLREVAFCFTQIASKDMSFINEDGYSVHLGSLLVFLAIWAKHLGIDIDRHIALKMRYNAGRVYKHGKKY